MACDVCKKDTSYEGYIIKQGAGMHRHYCKTCLGEYHDPKSGIMLLHWCFPKVQSLQGSAIK